MLIPTRICKTLKPIKSLPAPFIVKGSVAWVRNSHGLKSFCSSQSGRGHSIVMPRSSGCDSDASVDSFNVFLAQEIRCKRWKPKRLATIMSDNEINPPKIYSARVRAFSSVAKKAKTSSENKSSGKTAKDKKISPAEDSSSSKNRNTHRDLEKNLAASKTPLSSSKSKTNYERAGRNSTAVEETLPSSSKNKGNQGSTDNNLPAPQKTEKQVSVLLVDCKDQISDKSRDDTAHKHKKSGCEFPTAKDCSAIISGCDKPAALDKHNRTHNSVTPRDSESDASRKVLIQEVTSSDCGDDDDNDEDEVDEQRNLPGRQRYRTMHTRKRKREKEIQRVRACYRGPKDLYGNPLPLLQKPVAPAPVAQQSLLPTASQIALPQPFPSLAASGHRSQLENPEMWAGLIYGLSKTGWIPPHPPPQQ